MFLRKAEWFDGISADAQRVIDDMGTRETFKAGDVIFREKEEGRYFYILEEGKVHYLVGKVQKIRFLVTYPGEIFGWSSVVAPYRYLATALATRDSALIKVPRQAIDRILKEYPSDGERIYQNLAAILGHRLMEAYRENLPQSVQQQPPGYDFD